jgi:hypothetical protein
MVTRAQLDRLSARIDELTDAAKSSSFDPLQRDARLTKLERARRMVWGLQMAARAKLKPPSEPLTENEERGIAVAMVLAGMPEPLGEEFVARHVAALMAQFRGGPVDTDPVFCAIRASAREGEGSKDC